jgi:hypothetical protein
VEILENWAFISRGISIGFLGNSTDRVVFVLNCDKDCVLGKFSSWDLFGCLETENSGLGFF